MLRPGGREYKDRLFGGYVTAAYGYDDRYGVQATLRLDRSSQLAPDKQVAPSWSVGGTWNLHKERWMSGNTAFDQLSLRLGGGQIAASQADYDMVNPTYFYATGDPYVNAPTYGLVSLIQDLRYNSDLKWRTDTHIDAGLSLALWHRLKADVGFYYITSTDLVWLQGGDPMIDNAYTWVNDGEVSNMGVQFSLSWRFVQTEGLNLDLIATGIANKNEIVSLPVTEASVPGAFTSSYYPAHYNVYRKGQPVDAIYAYPSKGIDPATGEEVFSSALLSPYGSATPKLSGNFGVAGTAGAWNFGMMFNYAMGGKIYDYYTEHFVDHADITTNGPAQILEKWRKPGDNAIYQGFSSQVREASTRFVKTANTLSLGSVYVGYTFDTSLASKIYMKGLSIGVTCNDLLYLSSTKIPRGVLYPSARSFICTIKATF